MQFITSIRHTLAASSLLLSAVLASSLSGCVAPDEDAADTDQPEETSTTDSELLAPYQLLKSGNSGSGCMKIGDNWPGGLPQMHTACANEKKYAWVFTNGDQGHIRTQNRAPSTELCLGAGLATPGTAVAAAGCNGAALGQKWRFQPVRWANGKLYGQIVSLRSGACMATGGGAGAHPVMRACADVPNQLWTRTQPAPVPPPPPQCMFKFCFEDYSWICSARYREIDVFGSCNREAMKAEANAIVGLNYHFRNDGLCPTACF